MEDYEMILVRHTSRATHRAAQRRRIQPKHTGVAHSLHRSGSNCARSVQ